MATTTKKTPATKTATIRKVPAKKTMAADIPASKSTATATLPKTAPATKAPKKAAPAAKTLAAKTPAANTSVAKPAVDVRRPGLSLAFRIRDAGLTEPAVAEAIDVAPRRLREIIEGKRRMTADTAVRLATFFGDDAMVWLGYQTAYEIDVARGELSKTLAAIVPLSRAAQKPVVVREAS